VSHEDELVANLAQLQDALDREVRIVRVIVGRDGKPTGQVIRRFPLPQVELSPANGRNAPASTPPEDDDDHARRVGAQRPDP
jgi:hypothetical protein